MDPMHAPIFMYLHFSLAIDYIKLFINIHKKNVIFDVHCFELKFSCALRWWLNNFFKWIWIYCFYLSSSLLQIEERRLCLANFQNFTKLASMEQFAGECLWGFARKSCPRKNIFQKKNHWKKNSLKKIGTNFEVDHLKNFIRRSSFKTLFFKERGSTAYFTRNYPINVRLTW